MIGALNVGGAETLLMNLYRRVERSRVQFDFVVYDDAPGYFDAEVLNLGARIFRLRPPRTRGGHLAVADLRKLIQEHGPYRAVHAHVLHASAIAVEAAAREAVPIRIAHSHSTGDVPGGLGRRLYSAWAKRIIRARATQLVACGTEAGEYLFGTAPWVLLRNGVDVQRFAPPAPAERAAARAEFGVPDGALAVGAVARMEAVKNHSFLLDALSGPGMLDRDVHLLLAGDGSLREDLEAQAAALHLNDRVRFVGVRPDVERVMSALDVLVMPSLHEGLPVVLMEAQASALPCLVSDTVSAEADLGLGLVEFTSIDSPQVWAERIARWPSRPVASADFTARVKQSGGDIEASVELLSELYRLEAS